MHNVQSFISDSQGSSIYISSPHIRTPTCSHPSSESDVAINVFDILCKSLTQCFPFVPLMINTVCMCYILVVCRYECFCTTGIKVLLEYVAIYETLKEETCYLISVAVELAFQGTVLRRGLAGCTLHGSPAASEMTTKRGKILFLLRILRS